MSTIVELKREIAFLQAENKAFSKVIEQLQAENKKLKASNPDAEFTARFEAASRKLFDQVSMV